MPVVEFKDRVGIQTKNDGNTLEMQFISHRTNLVLKTLDFKLPVEAQEIDSAANYIFNKNEHWEFVEWPNT